MVILDVNQSLLDLTNQQSIGSRVWNRIYENRVCLLLVSSILFAFDFAGGFVIQDPVWVTPVMLATGMGGEILSLALLAREVDMRGRR